jgi:hypothetical protein
MRHFFLTLILGVAALLAAAPTYAQQIVAEVTIPFNFFVANTELPAGTYQLSENYRYTMLLRNVNTNAAAYAITIPSNEVVLESGALVFNRYGEYTHFLTQVRSPQRALNVFLPTSRTENEVKFGLPANAQTGQQVVVATAK